MKIGIITLHRVLNFGSVLQAYGTCVVLKNIGCQPEIIDYMEHRYTPLGAIKGIFKDVVGGTGRSLISKLVVFPLKVLSFFIQYRNFKGFVSAFLPVSDASFTTLESIKKNTPKADIYLTGSDQVWNSEYNGGVDRVHFLDFAPQGKPRVSYAASFGKDKLRSEEIAETRDLLDKYRAISVRERSGVEIIRDLGMEGAEQVLDPTLLLCRDEWAKEFPLVKPEEEAYLLIYSVERSMDDVIYSAARRIADAKGLKVVFLTQAAKIPTMGGCDYQRSFSKVVDYLRYFYYADFVVASSFHGTAFSVNFNRPFVSVLPPKYGSRPRSLLNLVGLSDRIVDNELDLTKALEPIDFDVVNQILIKERERSVAFLAGAILPQAGVVKQ